MDGKFVDKIADFSPNLYLKIAFDSFLNGRFSLILMKVCRIDDKIENLVDGRLYCVKR